MVKETEKPRPWSRPVTKVIGLSALMGCAALVLLLDASVSLCEQETRKITTYEVPTAGKIIDVIYVPEFDEWWVKCLEQGGVSIYSFDKRTKKWGQVRFVPSPTAAQERHDQQTRSPQKDEQASAAGRDEKIGDKKAAVDGSSSIQKSTLEQKGAQEEKKGSAEKKKWWNPLNLLKKFDQQ